VFATTHPLVYQSEDEFKAAVRKFFFNEVSQWMDPSTMTVSDIRFCENVLKEAAGIQIGTTASQSTVHGNHPAAQEGTQTGTTLVDLLVP
jgi:hypothetical protein